MAQSWIELHTDLLYDPKILQLHPCGRYAWVGLLLLARGGSPEGTWKARNREAVASDLACVLRLDDPLDNDGTPGIMATSIRFWQDESMISVSDDGVVTVLHWSQRQGDLRPSAAPEQVRERQRLSRMSRAVTRCHDRVEEKRVERSETATPLPPNGGKAAPAVFEEFWTLYPKKRQKGDALKAWKALKPDANLVARILEAVRSQRETTDWLKAQGRYVPYPATRLRAAQWEDELDGANAPYELAPLDLG
jgi:hypothetical protein